MSIEGVKVQRKDQDFLDEHFGVTPKWDDFHKKLKNKAFVTAVQTDTRTDDKLKAFVSALSMREQAKGPSVKAPSDVSGNYKVKYHPEHDRFSCTCPDWTFKRSVSGADCKHISRIKTTSKESLMDKTKVAAIDVLFRVGRALNQKEKTLDAAEHLKAENQVYSQAYPQQSFIQAFMKKQALHLDGVEMAKKMAQVARRMLSP